MLWPNPQERITTEEILEHPWLTAGLVRFSISLQFVSHVRKPETPQEEDNEESSLPDQQITQEMIDDNPHIIQVL